jgi:sulfate adenylyltransferase subunit 2
MDHLTKLEQESLYIIREAYNRIRRIACLWSVGKDSTVLLHLIRKAFFGHVPIPVVHIDTSYKIPEMIAFRDRIAREWNLNLVVGRNVEALAAGMAPEKGRIECCTELKTIALRQAMDRFDYKALFLGIRRDEEGTRAKERIFSPRDRNFEWNFKDQPPEFWEQFNTDFDAETHVRVHPLLRWTELDVWEYIRRERLEVVDLYFARDGQRYRSLGCAQCTRRIPSTAATVEEIIAELRTTRTAERAGRAQDQEDTYAMQKLRAKGYM